MTTVELTDVETSVGSLYAGVTSSGDIALVYNKNNSTLLDLHICPREGIYGSGMVSTKFLIDKAPLCLIDQINKSVGRD